MADDQIVRTCVDGPWQGQTIAQPVDTVAFDVYDAGREDAKTAQLRGQTDRAVPGSAGWYERESAGQDAGWYWRPTDG